jgi:hypothetical protein
MGHKCFISFKTQDADYKEIIQNQLDIDFVDKSLNNPINSDDENYIMRKIREDYLKDSTVTIALIGAYSAEYSWFQNQQYIKREMQASLYGSPNGILGVVLPEVTDKIYLGDYTCSECGEKHSRVKIDNETTIREFNYNYYLPKSDSKCCWTSNDRYAVLVKWEDFKDNPNYFVDLAFEKRSDPIVNKIKVYPK